MSAKLKFIIGCSVLVAALTITFLVWFRSENSHGGDSFTKAFLAISLFLGTFLIINSANPKSEMHYFYWMAVPTLIYFIFPALMRKYKQEELNTNAIPAKAKIIAIGKHRYRKIYKHYYQFETRIEQNLISKYKEDPVQIADWKLKVGDSITIRYSANNSNLIEVVGKLRAVE